MTKACFGLIPFPAEQVFFLWNGVIRNEWHTRIHSIRVCFHSSSGFIPLKPNKALGRWYQCLFYKWWSWQSTRFCEPAVQNRNRRTDDETTPIAQQRCFKELDVSHPPLTLIAGQRVMPVTAGPFPWRSDTAWLANEWRHASPRTVTLRSGTAHQRLNGSAWLTSHAVPAHGLSPSARAQPISM
jgi:hypothetical protein